MVTHKAGKGWLRGRDLNPRPLGYEFGGWFSLVALLSCCSTTYLFLFAVRFWSFAVLFVAIASEMLAGSSANLSVLR